MYKTVEVLIPVLTYAYTHAKKDNYKSGATVSLIWQVHTYVCTSKIILMHVYSMPNAPTPAFKGGLMYAQDHAAWVHQGKHSVQTCPVIPTLLPDSHNFGQYHHKKLSKKQELKGG